MKELFDNILAAKIRKEMEDFEVDDIPTGWEKIQARIPQKNAAASYLPLALKTALICTGLTFIVAIPVKESLYREPISYLVNPDLHLLTQKAGSELQEANLFPKETQENTPSSTDNFYPEKGTTALNAAEPKEAKISWEEEGKPTGQEIIVEPENRNVVAKNEEVAVPATVFPEEFEKEAVPIKALPIRSPFHTKPFGHKNVLTRSASFEASEGNPKSPQVNALPMQPWSVSFAVSPEVFYDEITEYLSPSGGMGVLLNTRSFGKWQFSSGVFFTGTRAKQIVNPHGFTSTELNGLVVDEVGQGPGGGKEPPRQVELVTVEASIWSFELPLQARYRILDRKEFSLFIEGGVSNFFNWKEYYFYREEMFEVPAQVKVPEVELLDFSRKYEHLESINWAASGNIAIGLEKYMKGGKSFTIAPFVRLPLNPIGVEEMDLRSAGLRLQYNFFLQ